MPSLDISGNTLTTCATKQLFSHTVGDDVRVLKDKYDSIIEGYPDRSSDTHGDSSVKPALLAKYIKQGGVLVSNSMNVLTNVAKATTGGASGYYSNVMRTMNDLNKLDKEVFNLLCDFFDGNKTDMYDDCEVQVVRGLLKFWNCYRDFVLLFQCDDCTIDVDSLKECTDLSTLETCMTSFMEELHCSLLKKRIIKISDTHVVSWHEDVDETDTKANLKTRVTDKLLMMVGTTDGLPKQFLSVAVEIFKLFTSDMDDNRYNVYNTFFKYDSECDECFEVQDDDFKTWVKDKLIAPITVPTHGVSTKTVKYVESNMNAVSDATFGVTLGHLNYDLFKQEVSDSVDELVMIDECDNSSEESLSTKLAKDFQTFITFTVTVENFHDFNDIKKDVDIDFISNKVSWKDPSSADECENDFFKVWKSTSTDNNDSYNKTKLFEQFDKDLGDHKQAVLDVLSDYVKQIDELYDVPTTTVTTTTATTATPSSTGTSGSSNMNAVIAAAIGAVALLGGVGYFVFKNNSMPVSPMKPCDKQ